MGNDLSVNVVRASVTKATAAESVSRTGDSIGIGKRTSRLVLEGEDLDSKFNVEIKSPLAKHGSIIKSFSPTILGGGGRSVSQIFGRERVPEFVSIKIMDSNGKVKDVSVKVDDLSKRLHLSKKEIIEAYTNKGLEKLINEQKTRLKVISEAANQYPKMSASYKEAQGLASLGGKEAKELMKITKIALKQKENIEPKSDKKTAPEGTKLSQQKYQTDYDVNGNLHIYDEGKKLAEGQFGRVDKVFHFNIGKVIISKTLKNADPKSQASLANEHDILEYVGPHAAIQHGIHAMFGEVENNGEQVKFQKYFAAICEKGDLDPNRKTVTSAEGAEQVPAIELFRKQPLEKKMETFSNLLSGAMHLKKKRVVHSDIKPANFLMKENGDVVFADFGGAKIMKKNSKEKTESMEEISHSRNYTNLDDAKEISNLSDNYNTLQDQIKEVEGRLEKLSSKTSKKNIRLRLAAEQELKTLTKQREEVGEELFEARNKHDVYSLGVSFFEMLTGNVKVYGDVRYAAGYPNVKNAQFNRKALEDLHYPESVISLIEGMVDKNRHARMTPEEAYGNITKALKKLKEADKPKP